MEGSARRRERHQNGSDKAVEGQQSIEETQSKAVFQNNCSLPIALPSTLRHHTASRHRPHSLRPLLSVIETAIPATQSP